MDRVRWLLYLAAVSCATVLWVVACGLGASAIIGRLADHPWLDCVIFVFAALLGAVGGFIGFAYTAACLDFCVSGYRMRWLGGEACVYEEFGHDGMLRSIPIRYHPLSDEYAPPCMIEVPSDREWESSTPTWAHGRREAILKRLTKCAHAGYARTVTFVPPGSLSPVT
jgi:hypothetical protein